jgi:AbrB family looped-hinge helix DNA binding protein
MKTTVSSKGQIVLPAEFRQTDRIKPGQEFEVQRLDRGDYRLTLRAAAHDLIVVTRNRDFAKAGVRVVDPFTG